MIFRNTSCWPVVGALPGVHGWIGNYQQREGYVVKGLGLV